MIRHLWIFIIGICVVKANAETDTSVLVGTYLESNTYYSDSDPLLDAYARVAPRLEHESFGSVFGLEAALTGSYNKHVKYPNQDYFDYNGNLKVPILKGRQWEGYVGGDYARISDIAATDEKVAPAETTIPKEQTRIDRDVAGGIMGTDYKWTSLSTIRLDSRYQSETYQDPYHVYMNNYVIEGDAFYDYQFLPETTFFIGGDLGVQQYPNGLKNNSKCNDNAASSGSLRARECKNNSQYIEGRSGIKGRLAEKTRVDASAAFHVRVYDQSSGFSEPIFNLKIEEQFSPKDLLVAGFDYEIHDSKWTNFVVDQTTFIGYSRILGDQVLLLGKVSYTYSSFSKPFKREDQRLAGSFKIDYSLSPKTKISGLFDIDILNSDSFNTHLNNNYPDEPVGYQYYRTGVEFEQYF
jgi:hypothetical protein